jgi:predicted DNA-binding transcriptional regulator YafY
VDFSPWGSDDKGFRQFTLIKDAILSHKIIEYNYFSSSGEKTARRVEPMRLIFKINAWYLQAFCLTRNELRMFKIVRMADVHVTEDLFTQMIPEPLPGGGQVQETQKWIELCLIISADGAYMMNLRKKKLLKTQMARSPL